MSNERALLDCTFGWGKTCRLYQDFMEIGGKFYSLHDLISVHPTYRKMFGVSSARLELYFGVQRLVLRGISNLDAVRLIVSHLLPYCAEQSTTGAVTHRMRSRSAQARGLARAQAKAWERTNNPAPSSWDAIPLSPVTSTSDDSEDEAFAAMTIESFDDERVSDEDDAFFDDELLAEELSQGSRAEFQLLMSAEPSRNELITNPVLEAVKPVTPVAVKPKDAGFMRPVREISEEEDSPISEPAISQTPVHTPINLPESPITPVGESVSSQSTSMFAQHTRVPRLQPPIRSVRLVQSEQRSPLSNAPIETTVKSSALPIIHVPVRLQPGECAHYSTGAALYSDQQKMAEAAPSLPMERGLLILTNRRIFYIGKRTQFILAYTQLWYVSRSSTTIALHIERQFRQVIFEIEHPDEWSGRIERLVFLARRMSPRSAYPRLSNAALPGLKPVRENPLTLKRAAIAIEAQKVADESGTTLKRVAAAAIENQQSDSIASEHPLLRSASIESQKTATQSLATSASMENQKTASPAITRALSPRARANQRIMEAKTVSLSGHRSRKYVRTKATMMSQRPVRYVMDLKTIDLPVQNEHSATEKEIVEPDNTVVEEKGETVRSAQPELAEKKIEVVKTSTPDGRRRVEEAEVETVLLSQLRDQDYEEVETLLLNRPEYEYEEIETISLRQYNCEDVETRSLRELEDGATTTTHLRGRRKIEARAMTGRTQVRERSAAVDRRARRISRVRSPGQSQLS